MSLGYANEKIDLLNFGLNSTTSSTYFSFNDLSIRIFLELLGSCLGVIHGYFLASTFKGFSVETKGRKKTS